MAVVTGAALAAVFALPLLHLVQDPAAPVWLRGDDHRRALRG
ncbi:hypothetical protein ACGFOU_30260 [Streptomyces sp. NPDC048595]